MSASQSGRSPSPDAADDRVYRAVAAGESADDVRRAIEHASAGHAPGSAAQQRAVAVNQEGPTGETPLHAAQRQRRSDLVGVLLESGADASGLFASWRATPLVVAVMWGLVDTVRALLKAGHDADEQVFLPGSPSSARHCTAAHFCVKISKLSPDDADVNDETIVPQLDVFDVLAREGDADVNARDPDGKTPLFLLFNPKLRDPGNAALDLLLSLGADVEAEDANGATALFFCAIHGNLAQLQRLLEHGASPDVFTGVGLTPLMTACMSADDPSRRDVVLELLRRSSKETRCAVTTREDMPTISAIEVILAKNKISSGPWHRRVVGELLASGAPDLPENAASVLPSAAERIQQTEDELAAQRSESRRWCAHGDLFDFAQDAKELREAQQGGGEARTHRGARGRAGGGGGRNDDQQQQQQQQQRRGRR